LRRKWVNKKKPTNFVGFFILHSPSHYAFGTGCVGAGAGFVGFGASAIIIFAQVD
jgi:hypothetical protein